MCCAAPIPPGRSAGGRQLSSSLNSNGLLSQKIASSESNGHLPNGNGCASTRQSSEAGSDEERPHSSSGSAKVGMSWQHEGNHPILTTQLAIEI